MSYFITIQYPYQYVSINLSFNTKIISSKQITKFQAMGMVLPALQQMLTENNLSLADIAAIGINTGPGPCNTLRSIIASANAIAFAKKIPLIGCNGLDLLVHKQNLAHNPVAILDAFGSDVYYAIGSSQKQGYDSISNVINLVNSDNKKSITWIGNGVSKYKALIMHNSTAENIFDETILFANEQSLVDETFKKYQVGQVEQELFPLYFESPVVK